MEYIFIAYMILALLLSLLTIISNRSSLSRMAWWKQLLFFMLLPILVVRELLPK